MPALNLKSTATPPGPYQRFNGLSGRIPTTQQQVEVTYMGPLHDRVEVHVEKLCGLLDQLNTGQRLIIHSFTAKAEDDDSSGTATGGGTLVLTRTVFAPTTRGLGKGYKLSVNEQQILLELDVTFLIEKTKRLKGKAREQAIARLLNTILQRALLKIWFVEKILHRAIYNRRFAERYQHNFFESTVSILVNGVKPLLFISLFLLTITIQSNPSDLVHQLMALPLIIIFGFGDLNPMLNYAFFRMKYWDLGLLAGNPHPSLRPYRFKMYRHLGNIAWFMPMLELETPLLLATYRLKTMDTPLFRVAECKID